MKLKKTKPLRVLGVAGKGNPHIFWGCGDEERNPFFWQKGGWNFLKSTPKELNFVTVIDIVKDCFCLGWIVNWHCKEQI